MEYNDQYRKEYDDEIDLKSFLRFLVRSKKGPQKPGQNKIDSNILNEQNKIQDSLGLNVSIQNKKDNSGKITILYKNLDKFELVSNLLKRN